MVKFLGLYDAWGSFLDFSPSIHGPVARKVGRGGKSGNFLGVGRNPQEMPIEAEGREDIDISSTRRWPEASADLSVILKPRICVTTLVCFDFVGNVCGQTDGIFGLFDSVCEST